MDIQSKFDRLNTDSAPGQETRLRDDGTHSLLLGESTTGRLVDFSHGDVDAFAPAPGSLDAFLAGVEAGGKQAYTEYRGDPKIREDLAARLASFTGAPVDARDGMIITPGTQGALFLAVASTVSRGDKVAIVQPDYFANRKLVDFCDGVVCSIQMHYEGTRAKSGLDFEQLEDAFRSGAKVFLFSNPNNPVGVVYSLEEIDDIAALARRYNAVVIVDQLYSRLLYSDVNFAHLRSRNINPDNLITIMGPSKTESLSGYRLGVAFGSSLIIDRMEKLQAIVSLRAGGYSQAVLQAWFNEPPGWMAARIQHHQSIRDNLAAAFRAVKGVSIRDSEAGSYIFPRLPKMSVGGPDFVRILRMQANVIVTPGTEFSPSASDSIRLNFSQDHHSAIAAVDRLLQIVERYRL